MAAATSGRITEEKVLGRFSAPVVGTDILYAGTLGVVNASGYAAPMTTATGLHCVGRICTRGGLDRWDNSAGAAAAFDVEMEEGIFFWNNSAAADAIAQDDVGKLCYGVDDQTVALTSASGTRSIAGIIRYVDATLGVAVESSLALSQSLLAESNPSGLTFTQTYSTAGFTVASLTSASVTDNTGGSTADAILAVVTAPAALTDNTTGVAATTLAAITEAATITDSSGGVDPGNNTIAAITNVNNAGSADVVPTAAAIAQLAAKMNVTSLAVDSAADAIAQLAVNAAADRAAIIALTNAVAKLAVLANALRADVLSMKGNDNGVIDALQAAGIAG